jgi:hypothetical protein
LNEWNERIRILNLELFIHSTSSYRHEPYGLLKLSQTRPSKDQSCSQKETSHIEGT